jgi:hypothetical protein
VADENDKTARGVEKPMFAAKGAANMGHPRKGAANMGRRATLTREACFIIRALDEAQENCPIRQERKAAPG